MIEAVFVVTMFGPRCGAEGLTATGTYPRQRRTVASDWAVLRPGTPVLILGVGPFVVEDKGVTGRALDVYTDSCREARTWGRRTAVVRRLPRYVSSAEWDELVADVARVRAEASGFPRTAQPLGGGGVTPTSDEAGSGMGRTAVPPGSTLPLALSMLGSFASLTAWVGVQIRRLL